MDIMAKDKTHQFHHTLRSDLIKDVLIWSGVFFSILGVMFALTLNSLVDYMLSDMATSRMSYQTKEFSKHLTQGERSAIDEESHALIQDETISGMIVIDSTGSIAHVSLHTSGPPKLNISPEMTSSEMRKIVDDVDHLRLYEAAIPGHEATLAIIMDKRPVLRAIYTSSAWTALLLFTLVGISVLVLHFSLRRHLIEPIDEVKHLMDDDLAPEEKENLIRHLPDEVAALAQSYEETHEAHELMEQQFREAQKMEAMGTLVGGIAHDFNNSLAGISGHLFLAKQEVQELPDTLKRLERIEKLTSHSAEMISNLLSFARKSTLIMKPFSFRTFVKETIKLNRISVPKNIELKYQLIDDELMVSGDASQLQQVILNIINNACHAVEEVESPKISITLDRFKVDDQFASRHENVEYNEYAKLSIRDNGHGISNEHLAHIFEPFYTTKEVGKGTGLGLSMAYGSIKAHGGMMNVESSENMGTAFHIYLPLFEAVHTPAPVKYDLVDGNGETVLIADDDDELRTALSDILKSINYKVLAASDGKETVEIYKQHRDSIDVVILDVVMPKMNGPVVARYIRETEGDTPIVFVTGYDREEALDSDDELASCCPTLKKPFSAEELSQVIHACIHTGK